MIQFIFNNQDFSADEFGMVICREAGKPDEVQFFMDGKELTVNDENAVISVSINLQTEETLSQWIDPPEFDHP